MEKGKFDWSLGEMGSKTTGAKPLKIEISRDPDGEKFSLYYSFPELNDRKDRKNILFIPGGPGSIPWLDQREPRNKLELLESSHNLPIFMSGVPASVSFRRPTAMTDFSAPTTLSKTSKHSGFICLETRLRGTRFGGKAMEL